MEKIEWLFFDIGSTLVDESNCVRERFNIIANENNINKNEFADKVLEYAKTCDHAIKPAAKFYGAKIPEWNTNLEQLYPDSKNVLETLSQKYKLGIIANQCAGTQNRIDNWGIGKYFDVVVASAEAGCAKPDLKIFDIALEQANCAPENAVMIGDRIDNDIIPAKKLGMKTVWVRQGFAKFQSVNRANEESDYIIESIGDITELF